MEDLRARSFLSLVRWLGPWTGDRRVPGGVTRETWMLRDGRLRGHRADRAPDGREGSGDSRLEAYAYRPRASFRGAYLISPGLHFLGPDDPRLDRFCRILAAAGFLVLAPFLPSFVDLLVEESAPDDLEACARHLAGRLPSGQRPALFSISFGSWPAFEVAARLGDEIDGVIAFGGYADFHAAIRFCVDGVMHTSEGPRQLARDPLNPPALFLNLLPFLDVSGADAEHLRRAWREMAYRTWGRMELKAPGRLDPIAREVARQVPGTLRELFLVGCGALPGAPDLVERGLARAGDALAFADPGPALRRLECPVIVCHGRDDDVIPWGEAMKLTAILRGRVPTRSYVTGLYGHTGSGRSTVVGALRESWTLAAMARALASAGRLRRCFRG